VKHYFFLSVTILLDTTGNNLGRLFHSVILCNHQLALYQNSFSCCTFYHSIQAARLVFKTEDVFSFGLTLSFALEILCKRFCFFGEFQPENRRSKLSQ